MPPVRRGHGCLQKDIVDDTMEHMTDLNELTLDELIELQNAVQMRIEDLEFMRNAEAESNNLVIKWHQAQARSLGGGEVAPWKAPTGAHDSYPFQWQVSHNGKTWFSTVAGNIWEPGVSGWKEVPAEGERPAWVAPTGAHDAYNKGDIVAHNDKIWISLVPANVWEPPEQWKEIIEEEPVDPEPPIEEPEPPVGEPTDPEPEPSYPPWKPWDHVSPLYQVGARVTHMGKNWEANTGNNHWEPGVYGWEDLGPA